MLPFVSKLRFTIRIGNGYSLFNNSPKYRRPNCRLVIHHTCFVVVTSGLTADEYLCSSARSLRNTNVYVQILIDIS